MPKWRKRVSGESAWSLEKTSDNETRDSKVKCFVKMICDVRTTCLVGRGIAFLYVAPASTYLMFECKAMAYSARIECRIGLSSIFRSKTVTTKDERVSFNETKREVLAAVVSLASIETAPQGCHVRSRGLLSLGSAVEEDCGRFSIK